MGETGASLSVRSLWLTGGRGRKLYLCIFTLMHLLWVKFLLPIDDSKPNHRQEKWMC